MKTWKWKVKVTQSCPTLCDLMDYTSHGILLAKILEWVAFLFSRGSVVYINCQWNTAAAKSLQSCRTLCDPIDGSPPGSPVPEILQARTLEWVAISSSSAWKWKVKVKLLSRAWLLATPWTATYQFPPPMGFSRQEYWSGLPLPFPTMEYYSAIKIIIFCHLWHMDGPQWHYTKWNKSDRGRQIPCDFTYMSNIKNSK